MPSIGRRKSASKGLTGGPGKPLDDEAEETGMDALVSSCLAAHAVIDEHGTPTMRRLIDLLLFEIGNEIGESLKDRRRGRDLN